ncbi:uncharacterized protein LOC131203498 [Ahaetulla prasina]|uniref:uncharacterized protein LOC131203498 n=1 Tax=Ahaetulla prasina TaxID=499056 RepID=UPI00264751E6|nr:uncharacterized protein LOC131203498 [Ahaetulla prasina]
MPELVRKWIAEAVHRELEAGKSRNRQSVLGAEAQSQDRDQVETEPADRHMGSRSDSSDSPSEAESSPSMEDEQWDQELSEEEGFLPEQPMFKGLFRPHLFKALLSKAKAVTKQGLIGEQGACPEQDPADMLFSEPTVETETVPAPKLFLDMIKKQWEAPAALPNMSSLERRFFNTASDLMELLRVPEVDDPVLALASSSATLVEPEEVLKPEDRKLEQALTKTHQAAAWGIRAATAASFYGRAVLLWLKQMQEKVPVTDLRTHQDFNKIVAVVEYTVDATMSSAKYVAKSIASSVTARRSRDVTKREIMDTAVQHLLNIGAVEPVPVHEQWSGYYSMLFVIQKASRGLRPILNLKGLNRYVKYRRFKMHSLRSILTNVRKGDFLTSIDLTEAYLHVPINRKHRRFLRFFYDGKHLQYRALPFGLALAPRVF